MNDARPKESGEPVFFLSYARSSLANTPTAPYEANKHVLKLFEDLTAHVHQLVDLSPGHPPGFMDMTMKGGEFWERDLRTAAGSCQVLVCLLSPRYLSSEWCAMEWDIFSRRKVVRRADGKPVAETTIVPVLWVPILEKVPEMVERVTRFSPRNLHNASFAPMYEKDGLYGVLTSDPHGAYSAIVWRLARHIQELHAHYRVKQRIPSTTKGLRRSFVRESV